MRHCCIIRFYLPLFALITICTLFASTACAKEFKKFEKDINNDGKIDRIAFFDDKEKIARLETDSNKDGIMDSFQYYLKIASVIWPDMQGTGHAAVVVYRKCPVTQQIRPKGAPEGFDCFEFWSAVILVSVVFIETGCNCLI